MDFLTWGQNPWGQQILTHISWDLLWASLLAGVMFLIAHASYMVLSAHRKRSAAETAALEAAHKDLRVKTQELRNCGTEELERRILELRTEEL